MPVKYSECWNMSNNNFLERYSRQILLEEIGKDGPVTLQNKKVAIVGIGALGTVAAELLVRAGVGKILLIDRDVIEETNLSGQVLFTEKDQWKSKARAAQERLQAINSRCLIEAQAIHLQCNNVDILKAADLIIDGTDNIKTRLLLNDFCKKEGIPWIYGAAIKTSGYVLPLFPSGPCLRCFLDQKRGETCDTVGVLNTITVSIAALQTTLALQILLGKPVESNLNYYDIWKPEFRKIKVSRNQNCRTCQGYYDYLTAGEEIKTIHFCGSGRYQILGTPRNLPELKRKWETKGEVIDNGSMLRYQNLILFDDGRALIKAASEAEAWGVYAKLIGN